ncbi:MAG TPA: DegT/DnrJ/EryC1/StrS family aminotransferase [Planctomycetota bacterium]|nr:DegT/DnrJ/EryC1/StrS family aminotransferase [Planctomycetota bacterium]
MSSQTAVTSVPLLDLKAQYAGIREEVRAAVDRVMDSQYFILGPEVEGLESEVAAYCGCRFGIGVSSGTDALILALMALDVGPGDEVITAPFTFFATAGSIHRLGARPVFVDIEPDGFNIDPAKIAAAVTKKTKAVIPVHLFGQCAEMDPITEVARKHNLAVIEDAAQAIGSEYRGRRAGSFGTVGCFSFFPSKNLGGFGDGGMVTTNDERLAARMRMLRNHGAEPKYYHKLVGGNFRLDALQAAVLRIKLRHLDAWSAGRQRNAARYREMFARAGLGGRVVCPVELPGRRHIYNQFSIRSPRRDAIKAKLAERKVGHDIYYPVPLHLQECFAALGGRPGSQPESERAAAEVLALPIYPELTVEQQQYVADAVASAVP